MMAGSRSWSLWIGLRGKPLSNRQGNRNDAGFTLVEILVAFVIAATVLVAAFELLSGNLRGMGRTQVRQAAVLIAQSRLAATGTEMPLSPGTATGRTDMFQWRLVVEEFGPPVVGRQGIMTHLYRVVAIVTWREGLAERSITLQSLRPGRLAEAS